MDKATAYLRRRFKLAALLLRAEANLLFYQSEIVFSLAGLYAAVSG